MADKRHEQSDKSTRLTGDIQEFIRKRTIKRDIKTSDARKHVEIQLLISELENLLMNMSQADPKVIVAKSKLRELKILIANTLHIK